VCITTVSDYGTHPFSVCVIIVATRALVAIDVLMSTTPIDNYDTAKCPNI